jgi:hypothetical protein
MKQRLYNHNRQIQRLENELDIKRGALRERSSLKRRKPCNLIRWRR